MKTGGIIGALFISLLLGGCASVSAFKGMTLDEDSVYISGLPPIRHDKHYACGATCVATVAAFWNIPLAEFRARYPQLPADMTGNDLATLATGLGLHAFAYRGSIDDLQENLRKGRPVIAMIPQPLVPNGDFTAGLLIKAWDKWGSKPPHWVVVIGLTPNQSLIIHDPASGEIVVKRDVFCRWWQQTDNLSVLLAAG